MTRNGICQKKNSDGSRIHEMKFGIMNGKSFERCEKCGTMFI